MVGVFNFTSLPHSQMFLSTGARKKSTSVNFFFICGCAICHAPSKRLPWLDTRCRHRAENDVFQNFWRMS